MNIAINNKQVRNVSLAAALILGTVASAHAATSGAEFQNLFNLIQGWATGYLGKALAIGAFLVGAIVGFAKSTAMPALIGIVFAILFSVGPGVIAGMMTATI